MPHILVIYREERIYEFAKKSKSIYEYITFKTITNHIEGKEHILRGAPHKLYPLRVVAAIPFSIEPGPDPESRLNMHINGPPRRESATCSKERTGEAS